MTQPSVSLACLAGSPLTELHHRAGIFSLSFPGLIAAGMPSGKPKNKTACASRDEYRGRVLRGSDRSAHSRLGPNCGQVIRKPQNNYGRSSQPPGERPDMFDLWLEIRQSGGGIKHRNVRGRCLKITHSRSPRSPKALKRFWAEFACGVAATLTRFHSAYIDRVMS
jgi:hypothetical protein